MKKEKVLKVDSIKVNGALDLSKPDGKQITMFEQKGFIKTTKRNKR